MTRGIKNNLPDRWCSHCGSKLLGRRQFKFCNSNCALSWHNKQKQPPKFQSMKCLTCGNFLRNKHQRKFCSHSCSAKISNLNRCRLVKKIEYNCLVCGKATHNKKFCSRECYYSSIIKYSTEEAKRRKRARQNEAWHRYMAKKKNQTPIDVDIKKLQEIYLNCPEDYEVDHKIPISKGGLHHPDNLQYLTISDNRKKSNKFVMAGA